MARLLLVEDDAIGRAPEMSPTSHDVHIASTAGTLLPCSCPQRTVGEPGRPYRGDMPSSDPTARATASGRVPGPAASSGDLADHGQTPTGAERTEVVLRVVDAAAVDAVDPDEAGLLISAVYRARHRDELAQIGRRLDLADRSLRSATVRRQQRRSFGWLAVCVLASALMIFGLLYGLGPIDPH